MQNKIKISGNKKVKMLFHGTVSVKVLAKLELHLTVCYNAVDISDAFDMTLNHICSICLIILDTVCICLLPQVKTH